jgi:nucleoid-associated protein Lsr2
VTARETRLDILLVLEAPRLVTGTLPLCCRKTASNTAAGVDLPRWRGRNQDDSAVEEAMARQTTVTLVDDLDGSNADEQVEFVVDGKSYAIDLSASNSQKLRDALAPFVAAGRRVGGRRSAAAAGTAARSTTARSTTDREQNQAIREWALKQGLKVSERGRISASVLEAFKAAH